MGVTIWIAQYNNSYELKIPDGAGFSGVATLPLVGENMIKKICPTRSENAIELKIDFFQMNFRA